MHGYSPEANRLLDLLYAECEKAKEKKPPKQSPKQKETAKKNVAAQREQGKGFDQIPPAEHKKLSKEGGKSERKKNPECKEEK